MSKFETNYEYHKRIATRRRQRETVLEWFWATSAFIAIIAFVYLLIAI